MSGPAIGPADLADNQVLIRRKITPTFLNVTVQTNIGGILGTGNGCDSAEDFENGTDNKALVSLPSGDPYTVQHSTIATSNPAALTKPDIVIVPGNTG